MRTLLILLTATFALSLASCTGDKVAYNEFVSLADAKWDKDTLAVFRAEISDTTSFYDIHVQVRNDNSYAFSNLWLFVDVISPDGRMRRDTIECTLANPDGSWIGGGWGSLYSTRCPYMMAVRFFTPGPYTFRLTQGMRKDQLSGIHDVGLLIEGRQDNNQ